MIAELSPVLAQSSSNLLGAVIGLVFLAIWLGLFIAIIVGMWKMYAKAGQPGWASLIPIYNLYILCKIVGRPGWWLILMLIPLVSLVAAIIVFNDLAKSFGRGAGTTIGLLLIPFVFLPILGFGSAEYEGPAAAA